MPPKKSITPIKYIEHSSLSNEASEDLEFGLSQLQKKVNKINGSMLKKVDLSSSQEKLKREMEKNMNENKE